MKIFRDQRGIAMTEGIIILPVLLILWASLYGVYRYYTVAHAAANEASRLAYRSAGNGDCSDKYVDAAQLNSDMASIPTSSESDLISGLAGIHPLALVHVETQVSKNESRWGKESRAFGSRILACNTKPMDGLMDQLVASVKTLLGIEE